VTISNNISKLQLNMSPDKEASTEMPDSEHDDSQNESTTRPRKTKNKKRTVSTEADFEAKIVH